MTKNDFLNTLYQSLLYLPAKERQEILQDYEEHFAAGIEEGKAEEEICRALGDPKEIAQTYLQQNKARPGAYKQDSPSNPAPVRNAGTAAAQPYPIPPDNGNRALFTVLLVLDIVLIALPGIPAGFALAAAGAVVLVASIAAGIFASSALLALFFISLAVALVSAGVLVILLIVWSLRACYRQLRLRKGANIL